MMHKKRFLQDKAALGVVGLVSMIGIVVLFLIFGYVFSNGYKLVSWHLITGDYYSAVYDTYYDGGLDGFIFEKPSRLGNDVYFSSVWGIGFSDSLDQEGKAIILINYVDPDSPLSNLPDKNNAGKFLAISGGQAVDKVIFSNNTILFSSTGAENAALLFDQAVGIRDMITTSEGKGIRGSLITTGLLVVMTLAIAIPFGVFTAVYLHEFAPKKSKIVKVLQRLIEMLSGMPSIIFGLLGAAVFIPFTSAITSADGGNLISGALTLAVIVLPTIISSTEEALKTVPDEFRAASLALGANKTQTTFKVVLKAAIPGVLAGVLLSIGRIIGESAALIYAIGTAIKDNIILTERSTSLAVHIWSIMAGEVPNFELASAISLIILFIVLILNMFVKLAVRKLAIDPSQR
jgi:phosphate transport system permease protein